MPAKITPSLLLFLLYFCGGALFAQVSGTADPNLSQEAISSFSFIRPTGPTLDNLADYGKINRTEGTPFLYEDWAPGRIRFEGQPNYSEVLDLLPDLESNLLYIRLSSGYVGEFPMERLDAIEVYGPDQDTVSYVVQNLQELFGEGGYGRQFYEVLHRGGRYMVLHHPEKYLRREEYVENLGMVRRPDKYMERSEYYVFDGTRMVEVKSNLRSISKAFPRNAATIKRLMRSHDLDLGDDQDLGRLFALLEASTSNG
ncbi:MAG: hypothetical protein AAFP77_11545 [Bacteroidota bacterium]